MARLWRQSWFLIALVTVLASGMAGGLHAPRDVAELFLAAVPPSFATAVVLFLMAYSLDSSRLRDSIRRPAGAVWGSVVNLGVLPALAAVCAPALEPDDFALGLIVTAISPSTLATASVFTRRAGGNDAVSLLVTLLTNVACVAVAPLWLKALVSEHAEVQTAAVVRQLAVCVLLPTIVGQLCVWPRSGRAVADRHRTTINLVSQLIVLTIVATAAVRAGLELRQHPHMAVRGRDRGHGRGVPPRPRRGAGERLVRQPTVAPRAGGPDRDRDRGKPEDAPREPTDRHESVGRPRGRAVRALPAPRVSRDAARPRHADRRRLAPSSRRGRATLSTTFHERAPRSMLRVSPLGGDSPPTARTSSCADAACAASARIANAWEIQTACPEAARADATQARELAAQVRIQAPAAIAEGLIREQRWQYLDRRLAAADAQLALGETALDRRLLRTKPKLRRACLLLIRLTATLP